MSLISVYIIVFFLEVWGHLLDIDGGGEGFLTPSDGGIICFTLGDREVIRVEGGQFLKLSRGVI